MSQDSSLQEHLDRLLEPLGGKPLTLRRAAADPPGRGVAFSDRKKSGETPRFMEKTQSFCLTKDGENMRKLIIEHQKT